MRRAPEAIVLVDGPLTDDHLGRLLELDLSTVRHVLLRLEPLL